MDIYLEIGNKRVFAGAIDWPGWSRSGRDEPSAIKALFDYGPRYAKVLDKADLGFDAPATMDRFQVVERLEGGATTDFGAPEAIPTLDRRPFTEADLQRKGRILQACWEAFDRAAAAATGLELRKGPRGGGRELEAITRHVLGAEQGYITRLAWKLPKYEALDLSEEMRLTRQAIMDALAAAASGHMPERGPRGGKLWPPRTFVRREAWHVLDHAWEIEDRVT